MVPSDYRLDHVTARLIERLEGARPSFPDDPEQARQAFGRVAKEHVEAALAEYREVALEEPGAQATLLRHEVLETFLPRYHRVAMEMTRAEESGFGFGPLAEPLGRLGLLAGAMVILWFVLLRLVHLPVVWPLVLLDLSLVFWPDIAAWLSRRRYLRKLHRIVEDMGRIQDQAIAYLPPSRLSLADADARRPTRTPEGEREG